LIDDKPIREDGGETEGNPSVLPETIVVEDAKLIPQRWDDRNYSSWLNDLRYSKL
jgi:hypothetical protein